MKMMSGLWVWGWDLNWNSTGATETLPKRPHFSSGALQPCTGRFVNFCKIFAQMRSRTVVNGHGKVCVVRGRRGGNKKTRRCWQDAVGQGEVAPQHEHTFDQEQAPMVKPNIFAILGPLKTIYKNQNFELSSQKLHDEMCKFSLIQQEEMQSKESCKFMQSLDQNHRESNKISMDTHREKKIG